MLFSVEGKRGDKYPNRHSEASAERSMAKQLRLLHMCHIGALALREGDCCRAEVCREMSALSDVAELLLNFHENKRVV